MGYDLNGKKYILSVNIVKYIGVNRDRVGSEADEKAIINTFKVSLYAQYHIHQIIFLNLEISWIQTETSL